jgi:hypothetical protein
MTEKKFYSPQANEVINIATKGLQDAIKSLNMVPDSDEKETLDKMLNKFKTDILLYFEKHVDRRIKPREKSLWDDLISYLGNCHARLPF